ncbi:hypothetical protein XFF6166_260017 [Xanthomonas citri pv. fuscans]|nr:hypothetical protein XFF6166_260017 [Xanthomonas citri pv. fuscans]SOO00238.1 hypothetical protein XFF6960_270003 [Xanthomonas citri pv. fuscans]SOO06572.1 hypothetical protein XFF7767_770017 [Xanthomonas citri pv. fuscans]SOO08760.1 hypothetical protein XFF6970_280017 [Xanthomonas citri pv. fuscans]SOO14923.1 hypothetical protein XFF7766_440003 [Xanthomonas citri pv. fuscans]
MRAGPGADGVGERAKQAAAVRGLTALPQNIDAIRPYGIRGKRPNPLLQAAVYRPKQDSATLPALPFQLACRPRVVGIFSGCGTSPGAHGADRSQSGLEHGLCC